MKPARSVIPSIRHRMPTIDRDDAYRQIGYLVKRTLLRRAIRGALEAAQLKREQETRP
jgi:hypothetical protein